MTRGVKDCDGVWRLLNKASWFHKNSLASENSQWQLPTQARSRLTSLSSAFLLIILPYDSC